MRGRVDLGAREVSMGGWRGGVCGHLCGDASMLVVEASKVYGRT